MDKTATLQVLAKWPLEERLAFLQEAWNQILDAGWQPTLTPELRSEIDRRLDAAEANPNDVVSWEEVVAHVRRPR